VLNVRDYKCTNYSEVEQREQPAVIEEWGVAAASIPAAPIPQPGTGPEDADEYEDNYSHHGGYIVVFSVSLPSLQTSSPQAMQMQQQ